MKVIYVIGFLIIYLEMIFKVLILKNIEIVDLAYTLLFSIQMTIILNLIFNIIKPKISKIILITISIILTLYFIIQAVFYNLFSIPFSFSTLGLAEGAMKFTDMIFDAIIANILVIILFFIPVILIIAFNKVIQINQYKKKEILISVAIIIAMIALNFLIINLDRSGEYSAYRLCYEIDAKKKISKNLDY